MPGGLEKGLPDCLPGHKKKKLIKKAITGTG
jgi:hypothetical protein